MQVFVFVFALVQGTTLSAFVVVLVVLHHHQWRSQLQLHDTTSPQPLQAAPPSPISKRGVFNLSFLIQSLAP